MVFSQNDPRWKGVTLGFYGDTLGNAGCFVTSFANVSTKLGHTIDPNAMNNAMKAREWFVDGCLVSNRKVPQDLFDNILAVEEIAWSGPADLSFFDDAHKPNVATIIMIDASLAQGLQTHFTMVNSRRGDDVLIDDSWDGKTKSITWYGDSATKLIYSAYKFRLKTKEEMMSKIGVTEARIIHSELEGWPIDESHKGKYDKEFMAAIGGKETNDVIYEKWMQNGKYREAREAWRKFYIQYSPVIEELLQRPTKAAYDELIAKIATASKQPVGGLTPAQEQMLSETHGLTKKIWSMVMSLFKALKDFINKK